MRSLRYLLYSVVFILLSGSSLIAQPPDPEAGDPDDNVVPITGIEWLLIAGGAMGGYKLIKKARNEDNKDTQ